MTFTHSVDKYLTRKTELKSPLFITGVLCLDATEATLYGPDNSYCVPIIDPEALQLLRSKLRPHSDYLGQAVLQAWVRAGPELHHVYWIQFFNQDPDSGKCIWGQRVKIREVPAEYDYIR